MNGKVYRVDGGEILIFGDLHISVKFNGQHRNYAENCFQVLDTITATIEERQPSAIILLGDLLGMSERKISDHQFLSRTMDYFERWNTITNRNVFAVRGNHDFGDFTDFDFFIQRGLIKNPKYVDYYAGKDSHLEVRFHFVNHGEEKIREFQLPPSASNVAIGHNDYQIDGVTNWYAHDKNGVLVRELSNFQGIELILSGHIHLPSKEVFYDTLEDGSNIGLFYPGSPTRPRERYDDCWYARFFFEETEMGGVTSYVVEFLGLKPSTEVFKPIEDFITEEDVARAKAKNAVLKEIIQAVINNDIAYEDVFKQIDNVPGFASAEKELAKSFLRDALDGGK